jgi:ubiquitin carboxyl-terminal hydrolase 4/11/15
VPLDECFKHYTAEELLSEGDPFFCSRCQGHRAAKKQIQLWKLPPVLVVHLKRFQYTHVYREKLMTLVDFPIDALDLSSYLIGPRPPSEMATDASSEPSGSSTSDCVYELYAVSVRQFFYL